MTGPVLLFHLTTLGDLLFSLPVLASLRQAWPQATLVSLARPYLLPLLKHTCLPHQTLERPARLAPKLRLASRLRKLKPSLALCLSQSHETTLLAALSGARRKVGFQGAALSFLLDETSPFTPPPCLANNLRLLQVLGVTAAAQDYVGMLPPNLESSTYAASLLEEVGAAKPGFVAIAPGTGPRRRHKAWPPERFAGLIDQLRAQTDLVPVLIGAPAEHSLAAQVAAACARPPASLVGRTDLLQLSEVLRAARLVIANDSGPMHLAAAVGAPTLGIFGPTNPDFTAPRGPRSRFVRTPDPSGSLLSLDVSTVLTAALKLLQETL